MWPISDACRAALAGPHRRTPVAEVYDGFGSLLAATYASTRPGGPPSIRLTGNGQISCDWTGTYTRSLSAEVVDVDGALAPALDAPALDPLHRPQWQAFFDIGWDDPATGVALTERIPAGRFVVTRTVDQEAGRGGTLQIEGTQRSGLLVADNAWLAPYNVVGGVPYSVAVIQALKDRTFAGWLQQFRFETSITETPFGMIFGNSGGSDPWSDLRQMAVSDGKELLEDQVGAFVYRTPPTVDSEVAPTAVYNDTNSTRVRGSLARDIDAANSYNGVVLRSSAPWLFFPVIATKWVDDPADPLYYLGTFGKKPFQVDDATVASQDQANAACAVKFNKVTGVTEQITFDVVPNPAHDVGDLITVVSAATSVNDDALLQTFTLPFDVSAKMPVTVQRRRRA